ncbi:MAG: MarR family winged helix-turn-helix transcriptional regulator [Oscillospiraceae bacterium]
MDNSLREQLIHSVFRFRKLNIPLPSELGLRSSEFFILKQLSVNSEHKDNKTCLSDIHGFLPITKSAVSQALNTLEKKRYILREIDRVDRRKISITLTGDGREAMERTSEYLDAIMEETISRFGEQNARLLTSLLNRLADILEDVSRENLSHSEGEISFD